MSPSSDRRAVWVCVVVALVSVAACGDGKPATLAADNRSSSSAPITTTVAATDAASTTPAVSTDLPVTTDLPVVGEIPTTTVAGRCPEPSGDLSSDPPVPGLTLALTIKERRPTYFAGTFTITNESSSTAHLVVRDTGFGQLRQSGEPLTDLNGGNTGDSRSMDLAPGEQFTLPVSFDTYRCGAASGEAPSPLPPGVYQTFAYAVVRTSSDVSYGWLAPPLDVTIE